MIDFAAIVPTNKPGQVGHHQVYVQAYLTL